MGILAVPSRRPHAERPGGRAFTGAETAGSSRLEKSGTESQTHCNSITEPMSHQIPPAPELLLAHAGFVRRTAHALLGGDDRVDDVVQDTFMAALTSGPRSSASIRAWLAGVVRNLALTVRRRDSSRGRREAVAASRERSLPRPEEIAERVPGCKYEWALEIVTRCRQLGISDQDRVFGPSTEAELEELRISLHGLAGRRVQVEERR